MRAITCQESNESASVEFSVEVGVLGDVQKVAGVQRTALQLLIETSHSHAIELLPRTQKPPQQQPTASAANYCSNAISEVTSTTSYHQTQLIRLPLKQRSPIHWLERDAAPCMKLQPPQVSSRHWQGVPQSHHCSMPLVVFSSMSVPAPEPSLPNGFDSLGKYAWMLCLMAAQEFGSVWYMHSTWPLSEPLTTVPTTT